MAAVKIGTILVIAFTVSLLVGSTDSNDVPSPREALAPFNILIGEWKGTGIMSRGKTRDGRTFWVEKMQWTWKFRGDDAWLTVDFDKGEQFDKGELHYLPAQKKYRLILQSTDKKKIQYEGALADNRLTLLRDNGENEDRLVIRLLRSNRFLYSHAVRAKGRGLFRRVYQVGATKKGVPFAVANNGPECIVTGGLGTSKVTYKGQTYYVCCSGCREAFNQTPEKFIREFEQKKKKK